ncbi:sodium-dependent phosphate transporter 1 [Eurytemora carolleeae]|uniref:sodium-dependent phosphate transporter 1 n=1 Tax=Eurytemora carolleeae TaxID=1294199 RepID=UPI000C79058B|nr:sodium-dependent phosphate transporter 1 [Eurytemora carolleeae]|eukprot:XP_023329430.1 sodium-dependent phosphate transporter 1-like [Eurytemora affinis]
MDISTEGIWNLVLYHFHEDFALALLIAGVIISFILSFAVGANDSANSWGTSVGAGTVSLTWAYILGSLMETIGATLLSGDVIKKVVNGIVNIDAYKSNRTDVINGWSEQSPEDGLYDERLLMVGCIAVMLSSGLWQLIASFFSWPVAGTHCIIFGLLGFTLTAKGSNGLKNAEEFATIVYMLFVSILIALVASAVFYFPLYKYCFRSDTPFSGKNRIIYGLLTGSAVGIPVAFIFLQTNKAFELISADNDPHWIAIGTGLAVTLIMSILAIFVIIPQIKNMTSDLALDVDLRCWKKGSKEDKEEEMSTVEPIEIESKEKPDASKQNNTLKDSPELTRIFRPLQVISAMTSALVHGGNDVANCIGPFVVIYLVYQEGILTQTKYEAPFAISLWGGVGISLGLIMFGKKVIMTMGQDITEMTPSKGFVVEWISSIIGLIFTAFGFMLSTTHCKVGCIIGCGLMQGLVDTGSPKKALSYVNFKVLSGVILSWALTIPVAMGLSSIIFLVLKELLIS